MSRWIKLLTSSLAVLFVSSFILFSSSYSLAASEARPPFEVGEFILISSACMKGATDELLSVFKRYGLGDETAALYAEKLESGDCDRFMPITIEVTRVVDEGTHKGYHVWSLYVGDDIVVAHFEEEIEV